jgi:F-type H+-transporting ATPase subunit b
MQKKHKSYLFSILAVAFLCQFSPLAAREETPPAGQPEASISGSPDAEQAKAPNAEQAKAPDAEQAKAPERHAPEVTLFGKVYKEKGVFGLKLFNFLLFAFLLIWLLKGLLASMFKARAQDIEGRLAQSEKDKKEAEAQLHQFEAKMITLEDELSSLLLKSGADAEAERQKILDVARIEAEQLLAHAHAEIEHQKRAAEAELRELVAKLAVEGAEKRVQQQMQGSSAAQVMDQAIQQIGGVS